jgi:NADH-quinone oxidoreductase subunit F
VVVCAGTGCVAGGAYDVFQAFAAQIRAAGLSVVTEFRPEPNGHDVRLNPSGCQGFCQMGPLVTLLPEGVLYTRVKVADVAEIVSRTLLKGEWVERLLYVDPATRRRCRGPEQIPFYQRQQRYVLRECGLLDPGSIQEYVHHGGYAAARKAFRELTPEQICQEIVRSGLRGRGGGGFPTGRKWEAARTQASPKKYVICNADEGDPGAFMNRSVMEGNPHSVLEGLMIAARAIGADETLIYVRAEYPLAVQRMRQAVADAEAAGFLGSNVFDSGLPCAANDGRRRRVCMRRGNRHDRLDRRPARHAPAQTAVTRPKRAVGPAHRDQQRGNPGAVVRVIREGAENFRKLAPLPRPAPRRLL